MRMSIDLFKKFLAALAARNVILKKPPIIRNTSSEKGFSPYLQPMNSHSDLTDAAFEQQFQTCTLDPALFSHEAHLRLAWIHIRQYGVEQAIENICTQLIAYTSHLGASDKYNKTLTIAATRAVYHFMQKTAAGSFADFIRQFPRLTTNFRDLIASHYTQDIFKSDLAKREYLEPDLLPFT
jgi:hypothetical protein